MILKIFIIIGGLAINYEELQKILTPYQIKRLKNELTITKVKIMGKRRMKKEMKLYKFISTEQGNIFFLAAKFSQIKELINKYLTGRKNKEEIQIKMIPKFSSGKDIKIGEDETVDLKEYQQLCINYLRREVYNERKIANGSASCIFVMDTGCGKTYIGTSMIEYIKKKTLIVIPNTNNLKGWRGAFQKYLPSLTIGEYHSKLKINGDIVIITIDSALSDNFSFKKKTLHYTDFFKQFGFLILDEIQDYPTPTRQEIYWRANLPITLGITATPDERDDEMDIVNFKHVGKLVVAKELPGFCDLLDEVQWKGQVEVLEYYGPPEYTKKITRSDGWVNTMEMQKQLMTDPYRNELILKRIKLRLKQGRYVFVFAVLIECLKIIAEMLKKEGLSVYSPQLEETEKKEVEVVKFSGGASAENEQIAYNQAKIILTTYSFGKQSVSIPRMDSIIFAQPMRKKMRQTIGRILRLSGDPSIVRYIDDIVDVNTSLGDQFGSRKEIFDEKKFSLIYSIHRATV